MQKPASSLEVLINTQSTNCTEKKKLLDHEDICVLKLHQYQFLNWAKKLLKQYKVTFPGLWRKRKSRFIKAIFQVPIAEAISALGGFIHSLVSVKVTPFAASLAIFLFCVSSSLPGERFQSMKLGWFSLEVLYKAYL